MGLFDFFKKKSWLEGLRSQLSTYEGCIEYLNNSKLQNDLLDPHSRKFFLKESVWPGRDGFPERFGYHPEYPIKVNSPVGALTYLSSLVTAEGKHLLFHRWGSVAVHAEHPIDLYECMATDGSAWALLFVDPYFIQKSGQIPAGLYRSPEGCRYIMGTNRGVANFPDNMREEIERQNSRYAWVGQEMEELRYGRYKWIEPPAEYSQYARELQNRIVKADMLRSGWIYDSSGRVELWSRDFRSHGLFECELKKPGPASAKSKETRPDKA